MLHDRIGRLIRLKPKQSPQDIGAAVDWREWVRHRAAMLAALAVILAAVGIVAWTQLGTNPLPPGIAFSNGRLEADRIDVATKLAGRIKVVLVQEGDMVAAGQVLARMDSTELEAQIREAEAGTTQAEQQRLQAEALVTQRKSELTLAELALKRSLTLDDKGYTPKEQVDQRRSARDTAAAALNSANAQVALSKATIAAAAARVDTLKANLVDSVLVAPRAGRIQYRLALGGEVLPAGGKVVTLLDLSAVYMTVYLPTAEAGRLAIGSEARIVLDAAPQYVVPATVTFVAADAQFTPRFVETKSEREKLMFRVKLQIPTETLKRYAALVKTGIPGLAYVKVSRDAVWPPNLAIRLPP